MLCGTPEYSIHHIADLLQLPPAARLNLETVQQHQRRSMADVGPGWPGSWQPWVGFTKHSEPRRAAAALIAHPHS
jgi:hypothetical protein